jgi:two-component system, NtrC family, nitrogen regulation response regulator GlnG
VRNHQHVVLCESDAVLVRVLRDLFISEGFGLTLCTSLAEIEAAIEQDPSAVVVTNSWLGGPPGLLGIDTDSLQQVAAHTTVVLTTAWTSESQLAVLDAHGLGDAVRVVPKPYDLDELLEATKSAVAAHRLKMGRGEPDAD